ncbi:matrixin family metalloprotease [Patescibacteria group bacterium]|nr:matrixin family metalloprotease [Patescibacteria group bacterium]
MINKKGFSWGSILKFVFFLFVLGLLFFYWIFPINEKNFILSKPGHSNFTLNSSLGTNMQFYTNMRYQKSDISYKIEDCPLPREVEMKRSFEWIENLTTLNFYETQQNEEISVTCKDTLIKGERGAFIAGEGGVTNVAITNNFHVILQGKVILIRESQCPDPIIGTHELLHALGFEHSENPNNIMYPTVNCNQIIGEDLIKEIDYLYSFPSVPDLSFENASAKLKGKYLDVNMTIRNNGLKNSEESKVIVYGKNKVLSEVDISSISIGSGRIISLTNIFTLTNPNEIELFINYSEDELNKKNNRVLLEINN